MGSVVIFQPDISKINFKTMTSIEGGVISKIVAIKFSKGKVLYDLALKNDDSFYEELPICNVDSVFVCPVLDKQCTKDNNLNNKNKFQSESQNSYLNKSEERDMIYCDGPLNFNEVKRRLFNFGKFASKALSMANKIR